ncbi:unnamed protein product [Adineta steineri]|uniref:F-box domain-containing protein n=1 Tax=Adineta steineri TaxID=433720 RepID=A0A814WWF9_9BILA|nr:unnamed protein product [Adineta steineri]
MDLEDLANEIILEIFGYFSTFDLLRSFYNLNIRFNHLVFAYFHTSGVDFSRIFLQDFYLICQEYLPAIADHITSLRLTNDDDTPQQADVFLQHGLTLRQLHQLRKLSLCDICSNDIMHTMMSEWTSLRYLTHLTLAGCYLTFDQSTSQSLIDTIWSLPILIYCYLNISFEETSIVIPTVKSMSLKYLFIWGFAYDQSQLNTIFQHTPCLEQCSVLFNMDIPDQSLVISHPLSSMTRLRIHSSHIEDDCLVKFLQIMPNLYQLIIDVDSLDLHSTNPILNGYQWETIIRFYLPHLRIFRLRIEFSFPDQNDLDKQVDDLLKSFRSSFWLEEYKWFVRCHWNQWNTACLYTLPYKFADLKFDSSMKYKSTCPNDNHYLSYNHVEDLQYKILPIQSPMVSSIRFMNVDHLSIEFPMDMHSLPNMPRLDQVTSLEVCIINNYLAQSKLQTLLNQMHCLSSFSFHPCSLSLLGSSFFKLTHTNIRRLDFRIFFQYFDDEQCTNLCDSPLGKQCEVLSIKVKKRESLPDLINNMINLRTLNIQFEDDLFEQVNDDELVHWLRNHLPSTCLIGRDTALNKDIRIWIR